MTTRILKQSPLRRVELVQEEDGTRVHKLHRGGRRAARRAHREARALERLRNAGVPAPRVFGVLLGPEGATLRLEALPVRASLDEALPALADEREREALLVRALDLLERALDAGVLDPDCHAGNVWLGPAGELWLADLHRSRRWPGPFAAWRAERIRVGFLRFFLAHLSPQALLRTLERWRTPEAAARLLRRARRSRRALLCGKDERARGGHRAYEREHVGAWRRVVERDLDPEARALLQAFERAEEERPPATALKRGRRSSVWHVQAAGWVVKELRGRGAARRARAVFRAALALHHAALPVVPLRALSTRRGRALLLAPFVPGPTLAHAVWDGLVGPRAQRRLARELGRDLARLHEDGLRLRDLRGENWIVDGDLRAPRLRWIDLGGARRRRRATGDRRIARDLARCLATFPPGTPLDPRAVALGLCTYERWRGWEPQGPRTRQLVRRVLARREALWRRWRRRGWVVDARGIHARPQGE